MKPALSGGYIVLEGANNERDVAAGLLDPQFSALYFAVGVEGSITKIVKVRLPSFFNGHGNTCGGVECVSMAHPEATPSNRQPSLGRLAPDGRQQL